MIRAYNPQAIPLVAGFDWAYDLTPLRLNPIAAEGIGYTTHPYANKRANRGNRNGRRISVLPPASTRSSPPNSAASAGRLSNGASAAGR